MLNFPNALQHLKIYWKKLLYCTRMQLFIDWKVETNHWKPDCSIHGSWTPTARHRTGPRHHDENLHEQPYVPDGRPALYISPSRFIQTQYWFHREGEVPPTWSQEQAGGKTENTWHCNTKQDMQLRSSSGLSESAGQRYKTSFNSKQVRKHLPSGGFTGRQCSNEDLSCFCHEGICVGPISLYWVHRASSAELIWLKALLQCRGCPELPGRIHRWCFLCGSSLAVYFADEQKRGRGSYRSIYPGFLNTELRKQVE